MNPTSLEIKAARKQLGLTQTQAGKVVSSALRTWQAWEYDENKMPPGIWELFQIKTGLTATHIPHKMTININDEAI